MMARDDPKAVCINCRLGSALPDRAKEMCVFACISVNSRRRYLNAVDAAQLIRKKDGTCGPQ